MPQDYRKVTVIKFRLPSKKDINEKIKWFCSSLGLFSLRDRDSSCYRIFIEILKGVKSKTSLSSDEIARKLGLSRGTVIHHINRLIESGLVVSEKNRYFLRVNNLKELIEELEKDVKETYVDLKKTAKEIDRELGL